MDAEYLKENIGEVLALGLTDTVIKAPTDPVEHLAKYLLKYVENLNQENEAQAKLAKLKAQDEAAEAAAKKKADNAAAEAAAEESSAAKKIAEFEEFLNNSSSMTGLLEGFIQHLKVVSGASNVYIGSKQVDDNPPPPTGDEDEGEVSTDVIKYVATTDGQEFLLDCKLRANQGITHGVFKADEKDEEEEPEEDEDEDGEAKPKEPAPEPEDKSIFLPNVQLGENADDLHFWGVPNLGSYFAMHLPFDACLSELTLEAAVEKGPEILEMKRQQEEEAAEAKRVAEEEAAALAAEEAAAAAEEAAGEEGEGDAADGEGDAAENKEEEEPAEEEPEESEEEKAAREAAEAAAIAEANELFLISHLPKDPINYVVCLDTLTGGQRFTEEQIALIKRFIKMLKETMLRLDRALFKEERLKRETFAQLEEGVEEPTEDDVEAEKAKILQNLEKDGLPSSDADVQYKYRQGLIHSLRGLIAEFQSYHVFRGQIQVMQALFYLLDYTKEEVADVDNKPVWSKMRKLFNDKLFNRIQEYDPRPAQKRGRKQQYATIKKIKAHIAGLDAETIRARNYPLSELYLYLTDALEVKMQVKRERAAAKKAAEEAEAAAAAAAAEAAEGEGDAAEGDEAEGGEEEE